MQGIFVVSGRFVVLQARRQNRKVGGRAATEYAAHRARRSLRGRDAILNTTRYVGAMIIATLFACDVANNISFFPARDPRSRSRRHFRLTACGFLG